jgi:Tol biopolymer transport system component
MVRCQDGHLPARRPCDGRLGPAVMEMWTPTYSPDGTKFAMESWGYDTSNIKFAGIVVMNTDGSKAQLLTSPLTTECYCFDTAPSYTADGTQTAFARVDETNALVSAIYSRCFERFAGSTASEKQRR